MKAVTYHHYGSAQQLRVEEIPDLGEPPRGFARVQVHACALNPKDVLIRKGKMRWLTRGPMPRVSGYDVAGVLLDDAGELKAGSRVYGMIQDNRGGGCAQVAMLHAKSLAPIPDSSSMVEAASIPLAGLTALQGLRDQLGLREGDAVYLNGASGGVGSMAVQIGAAMGLEVTGICSGKNVDYVLGLGAKKCIDYTKAVLSKERGWPHLFDIFGSLPWPVAKSMLRPSGRYCTTIPSLGSVTRGLLWHAGLHRASFVVVQSSGEDLRQLNHWVEQGVLRAQVELVVSMEEAAKAHLHLESRRTRGKVVIQVQKEG